MISRRLLATIGCFHAVFILVQIYLYTQYVAASYARQKNEQLLAQIKMQHQEYVVAWHQLHDLDAIQKIAQSSLKLQKITLAQIKRLPEHDCAAH